ncbi:undecaprenyl pyrophosphate synthase [Spiroplasma chinense]|uniref:Isoprenyl transferase n=1 Tax=Spiroplasma chinense TaxID=216932 RepID=A0A5B9Y6Z9_9MOLU|nr:polyprenyl diphosphate synthase [Spiroplasma chinense]QEH62067.1 undecaprenyl pyrophosphate synthase [Spiroplasma chinense]
MKPLDHVAIILDGNGRWAQERNKPRTYGHRHGLDKIFDTILFAKKQNIKYITLFCFSTENWNRPEKEVKWLMDFPVEAFNKKQEKKYIENGICVNWVGRRTKVPNETKKTLEEIEKNTKDLNEIFVNFAFDYGSYEELENTFKIVFNKYEDKNLNIDNFSFQEILDNLYTKNSPNIDLLIRTGGEQRLSNFMLLQSAYAEFYFTKTYWPDFNEQEFEKAINSYKLRDRRFGKIEE